MGALAGALAFRAAPGSRPAPLALLSSKACCGHTEGTAGLAGDGFPSLMLLTLFCERLFRGVLFPISCFF